MPPKRQVWLGLALLCAACMYFNRSQLRHDSDITPVAIGSIKAKPLTDLFQPPASKWASGRLDSGRSELRESNVVKDQFCG
jgi:hypothetical protein